MRYVFCALCIFIVLFWAAFYFGFTGMTPFDFFVSLDMLISAVGQEIYNFVYYKDPAALNNLRYLPPAVVIGVVLFSVAMVIGYALMLANREACHEDYKEMQALRITLIAPIIVFFILVFFLFYYVAHL